MVVLKTLLLLFLVPSTVQGFICTGASNYIINNANYSDILEAKECEQDFCVILHGVINFGNDSFHGSFVGCKNEFEEMMDANNFMQWQHYLDDMNTCSSPNGFHLLFANNDDGYLGAFTFKCTRKGEDIHKIKAYHAKRGNVEIGRKSGFRNESTKHLENDLNDDSVQILPTDDPIQFVDDVNYQKIEEVNGTTKAVQVSRILHCVLILLISFNLAYL